jgi:hypothetical protein
MGEPFFYSSPVTHHLPLLCASAPLREIPQNHKTMTDQKLLPVAPDATVAPPTHNDERALFGKIARLPNNIRAELNQRLFDGHVGSEILGWLNDLPRVKEILVAQFSGVPVSHENLSNWRHSGYQRWLQELQQVSETGDLGKYADLVTKADSGRLAPAAATVASGKILKFLDSAKPENTHPDELVKCAAAASALLKGEHNQARIGIAKERLRQREMLLILKRDKQQRDQVALALRLLGDQRAKEIEAANFSNHIKIELLGRHMYDDLWEPRPIPVPPSSSQLQKTDNANER